eukprot:INCI13417.8.p1 GENE.INCI13417.8~~INCI13417.8.p1  ORF type:complete len:784 (-),score=129.03 INCI13417.8:592-2943(-)
MTGTGAQSASGERKKRSEEKQRARNERRLAKKKAKLAAAAAEAAGNEPASVGNTPGSAGKPARITAVASSSETSNADLTSTVNSESQVQVAMPKKKRSAEKQRLRNERRLAKKQLRQRSTVVKVSPPVLATSTTSNSTPTKPPMKKCRIGASPSAEDKRSDAGSANVKGSTSGSSHVKPYFWASPVSMPDLPPSLKPTNSENQHSPPNQDISLPGQKAGGVVPTPHTNTANGSAAAVVAGGSVDQAANNDPEFDEPKAKRKRSEARQKARNARRLAKKAAAEARSASMQFVSGEKAAAPATNASSQPKADPSRESIEGKIKALSAQLATATTEKKYAVLPKLAAELTQLTSALQQFPARITCLDKKVSAPSTVCSDIVSKQAQDAQPATKASDGSAINMDAEIMPVKRKRSTERQKARNERRLAKKRAQAELQQVNGLDGKAGLVHESPSSTKFTSATGTAQGTQGGSTDATKLDPSGMYLPYPLRAPIVGQFRRFFSGVRTAHGIPEAKVFVGPHAGWRTIARLTVRAPKADGETSPIIGIFAPGSHDVIPMLSSKAHHPAINSAVEHVSWAAKQAGVRGYNGVDHGGMSYVGLSVESSTQRIQLVIVFNCLEQEQNREVLARFVDKLLEHDRWLSIWCHYHKASRHDNAIFGREGSSWVRAYPPADASKSAEPMVVEVLDLPTRTLSPPPRLRFPPNVFRQANLAGFTAIIREIRQWMDPSIVPTRAGCVYPNPTPKACSKCVELYGGVGTIGLNILDLVQTSLSCSDENPFNQACFFEVT